ncbi:MAG: thioredoxin family protein [Gammaproteobacteria bacterium]
MSLNSRPFLFAVLLTTLLALTGIAMSDEHEPAHRVSVPDAEDLQADAALARANGIPILLVVTQHYCGFCETLKDEVIRPMILSGDYDDRVLIRELVSDDRGGVRDFDGVKRDAGDIARRYRAWLTPTLVFLGPDGQQLQDNIRGVNTLDYYSYYVDEAIAAARKRVGGG